MINSGEEAFLILCDELNFTRAAERCFMTQQGLSTHIKKLEEQYSTKFFIRKPNVELTESGKALRLALLKKKSIDEDLARTIKEIDSGSIGKIRFGINSTRAAYLAPQILKSYCPKFPKMEIHFTTGDTEKLVRELREGKIDGLLGVNAIPAPDLMQRTLFREKIFLVLKEGRKNAEELSLMELAAPDGPIFVRNEEGSTLNKIVDNVLAANNIYLKTQAFISDYSVQLSLCKALGFAVFCPESLVFAAGGPAEDSELRVYHVREITERMTVSLITDAGRYYPKSAEAFFRSVLSLYDVISSFVPIQCRQNK